MKAITPTYLRDLAAQMSEYGRTGNAIEMYDSEIEAALRAAAGQLEAAVASEESATQQVFDLLDERAKLRAVVENAPHDSRCTIRAEAGYLSNCTCWKADVR